MATNKHAMIRYNALDKCFRNFNREYYIEDLMEICSQAIYSFTGINTAISRRQIYYDITFMKSDEGWSVPLEKYKSGNKHKSGNRVYYRYSDKNFSISNKGINHAEAEQLRETLTILSRFEGMPQFEWIGEMNTRLEKSFKLSGDKHSTVIFDSNPYLKGMSFFTDSFHAIQNQKVLTVDYQSYKRDKAMRMTIHPWFLKQYNNRWFLFGYNQQYDSLSNLALDRIVEMSETDEKYIENKQENIEELFEDIIGVTLIAHEEPQKVHIKIARSLWPYIESKPLHGSQKVISHDDDTVVIELDIQINHEFKSLIFSYMNSIEILKPASLRDEFKDIVKSLYNKYF